MTEEEILALQTAISDLRKQNDKDHKDIFAALNKMNGGLGTAKWMIGLAVLIATSFSVPILTLVLYHIAGS